jgi:hypothetical protein
MQAVRTASHQSPSLVHSAGQSTQLEALRAAFLSESAPAAEPEPTLPPDAASAVAQSHLFESTDHALAPPKRTPPHYKHRALGEPGTVDAAADTAAAPLDPTPPHDPPAATITSSSSSSPAPPAPPAAAAEVAKAAEKKKSSSSSSSSSIVSGDDDGGGPKGLRPGFVGKHDAARKGKPLALHGPAGGGVLRAEGQAAGPDWLVKGSSSMLLLTLILRAALTKPSLVDSLRKLAFYVMCSSFSTPPLPPLQVDPHAATHAAIRAEASGSLLGALRRHHLVI